MAKNVLFLVTGMTPQIVTETVWALACDPENTEQWIPDEIHVMSTQDGLNQIRSRLFVDGIFAKFKQDYSHLSQIQFNDSFLHVIQDENNNVLKDLKTPDDNTKAANAICEKIREFTIHDDISLHVSIAGGRKTMGFYAGYALSLYGRIQDKMSHVLVSSDFENLRNFYYPASKPKTKLIKKYLKKIENDSEVLEEIELDAHQAKIWLANIPFVRLRTSLPESSLVKSATFSDVVNVINMANQPFKIIINIKDKKIKIGDKECSLSAREFAFYLWFVKNKLAQQNPILAPEKGIIPSSAKIKDHPQMVETAQSYLKYYLPLKGKLANESVQETLQFGMERTFFDERLTALRRAFKATFGVDLAKKIEIKNLSREMQTKEMSKEEKKAIQGYYQLFLNTEQIEIIES